MLVAGGATDVTTYFALRKSADGTAAIGLTITGFDLQYVRSGAAPAAKVDATALAATDSVHADNKAIEIDATDQPGLYRIDWPDAAFAAGVREVILSVKVATAFTEHLRAEIDGEVNVVEWAGTDVVAGAIPAVVADGAGGLPISDAGGLDIDTKLAATNEVTAARMAALTDWINGGRLDLILDAVKSTVDNNENGIGIIIPRLPAALVGGKMDSVADVIKWLGTAVTAATAGKPDVNIEAINNLSIAASTLGNWVRQGISSTADSGTATTLVDASLTHADGRWNGALLVFTSGSNSGYSAAVTDFDAASDTLTFTPAVPANVTTEGYTLVPGLGWAAGDLSNATDGLGALKALIDTVNTDLSNGTDGLGALKALIDTLDIVADAIKVVTDKMVFTKANELDVNTKSINDAEVVGDGNATPWDGV